uniref:LRAT domain-containing protein n=1 Tax=Ficedula albicollis TaxID=59894 RepID=U3K025_FICAL
MGQDNCKPQPGDLIEIDRPLHHHWALYMGDGYVIHLIPIGKREGKKKGVKVPVFIRTVKKELLMEVAGNDKYRVNNKSDQDHTPLPVEKIISCAVAYIGKELTYCSFGSNCERFVKKLRYGEGVSEQWRVFVGNELHILDMRDDKEYPKPGDLIEIKREYYDHWALYVGDGYVIHLTPVDQKVPTMSTRNGMIVIRTVMRELLKEVAGNDAWAVNNKYDKYRSPLPVEEIIRRAEGCISKNLPDDVFCSNIEHFVTKLRYGGQLRAFVNGMLHILDIGDDEDDPIPGDLIEIKREYYDHWALYVGDGYVIHVTPIDENSPPMSAGSVKLVTRKVEVKKELLEETAGKDNWRVNNKYDPYRKPFPVEEIIRRAESQIGKVVLYQLFYQNCEHFVTEVRYGEAVSEQVSGPG